jgi:hypothetical protein
MTLTTNQLQKIKKSSKSCRNLAKHYKMSYNTFRSICLKNAITFSRYKNNGHSELFGVVSDKKIAYLLGLLWADGYILTNKSGIGISMIRNDINDLLDVIPPKPIKFSCYFRQRKGKQPSKTVVINDKILVEMLNRKFSYDTKSNKFFDYNSIDERFYGDFLRGYLDGDGHIGKTKVSFSACYNYDWTNMINLLKLLNIEEYKIRLYISKKGHKSSTFIVNRKANSKKLLDFIYSDFIYNKIGLSRKFNAWVKNYF